MDNYIKKCSNCKQDFSSISKRRKFCSICREKQQLCSVCNVPKRGNFCKICQKNKKLFENSCLQCGKKYLTSRNNKIYCNQKCLQIASFAARIKSKKSINRWKIFVRDNFTCVYCNRSSFKDNVSLAVDHIHPLSKGGSSENINLVTACNECNSAKKDNVLTEDVYKQVVLIVAKREPIYK